MMLKWRLWHSSHWPQVSRSKMGCNPILKQLHCGQWELCRKSHGNVDATLTLTLGVNGSLTKFKERLLKTRKRRHPSLCRYSLFILLMIVSIFYGVCFLLMNLFPNLEMLRFLLKTLLWLNNSFFCPEPAGMWILLYYWSLYVIHVTLQNIIKISPRWNFKRNRSTIHSFFNAKVYANTVLRYSPFRLLFFL